MTTENPSDRGTLLSDARRRLAQLEAETHRLRGELARLEAAGEDAAAEQIEARLRQREGELNGQHEKIASADRASAEPTTPAVERAAPAEQAASRKAAGTQPSARVRPRGEQGAKRNAIAASRTGAPKGLKPERHAEKKKRSAVLLLSGLPAWAVSLVVHAVMLLLLGAISFATLVDTPKPLLASSVDGSDEYFDELAEFDFDQETPDVDELTLDEMAPEFDAADFAETPLSELDAPWSTEASAVVSPAAFDATPSDLGALMAGVDSSGGAGQGGASSKAGGGPRGGAKFFGARSKGGRFVFVVDNSGTMKEGRLETTLMEIERSVASMADNQLFHVVFYSDQVYPMFFPEQVDRLVPATRENKQKLSAWLGTVEMCVGGEVNDALELAAGMKPDTVFLLSDGDIYPTRVERILAEQGWGFVINTLGMTVAKPEHAQTLLAIAKAHNGLFFPVGVNPAAAQMARRRPVPYHNSTSGPGPVWGSEVR